MIPRGRTHVYCIDAREFSDPRVGDTVEGNSSPETDPSDAGVGDESGDPSEQALLPATLHPGRHEEIRFPKGRPAVVFMAATAVPIRRSGSQVVEPDGIKPGTQARYRVGAVETPAHPRRTVAGRLVWRAQGHNVLVCDPRHGHHLRGMVVAGESDVSGDGPKELPIAEAWHELHARSSSSQRPSGRRTPW